MLQRNNLCALSFLDHNGHSAAAGAAEPEILALAPMVTDAALMDSFRLGYEDLAIAEGAKDCGA
jgi:hypothetical protein